MALQLQLENGSLVGGGGAAFKGANVHAKPLEYGSFGHYRAIGVIGLATSQAANSRLFELRNAAANWVILTSLEITVLPIGAVAAPYALYLGLHRCTAFTAVDTTNVITVTGNPVRTSMPAAPGGVEMRQSSGVAAGMTGGTLTKQTPYAGLVTAWAASVSVTTQPLTRELVKPVQAAHPFVFQSNEGVILENTVLGSASSNQLLVTVDLSWAEVPVGGF